MPKVGPVKKATSRLQASKAAKKKLSSSKPTKKKSQPTMVWGYCPKCGYGCNCLGGSGMEPKTICASCPGVKLLPWNKDTEKQRRAISLATGKAAMAKLRKRK